MSKHKNRFKLKEPEVLFHGSEFGIEMNDKLLCWSQYDHEGRPFLSVPITSGSNPQIYIIRHPDPAIAVSMLIDILHLSFRKMGLKKCDLSLSKFIEHHLNTHKYKWVAENTFKEYYKAYAELIADYPAFKEKEIEDIWDEDIENWQDSVLHTSCPDDWKRSAIRIMTASLTSLYDQKYYHYDLGRHLHRTSFGMKSQIKDMITTQTLQTVFSKGTDEIEIELCIMIFLLALRKSEGCALRWDQFSEDFLTVTIDSQLIISEGDLILVYRTKNGRKRRLCLSPKIIDILKDIAQRQELQKKINKNYNNPLGYLFTKDDGSPINPRTLARNFHNLTEGKMSLHDWRRLAATVLYESLRLDPDYCNGDINQSMRLLKIIADYLGHEDTRTTSRYILHAESGIKVISRIAAGRG